MTNKNPLVSIIILSYRNYNYIYEAIDSVLFQNYRKIELIISNDGSTDFKKETVLKYLQKNCHSNIVNFIVNNNEKNIGTVKNINRAIKMSKGEYILAFAADDILYDNKVVSKFVSAFSQLSHNELIVTSQIGMFDTNLKKLLHYFVSSENKEKIQNLPPKKLFAEMSTRCIIPGPGTCYKREIFDKYGYFDEKYLLIEDYSSALKFSRLGIKFNFFDFVSIRHRDGGISHGNILGDTFASKKYEIDIINIYKNEVLPYLSLLDSEQKNTFIRIYNDHKWRFAYKYDYLNGTKAERRKFVLDNITTITSSFFYKIYDDLINQIRSKKIKIFYLGLILLTIYTFNIDYGSSIVSIFYLNQFPEISSCINHIIGLSGLFLTLSSIILTIYMSLKRYFVQAYKFIRLIF